MPRPEIWTDEKVSELRMKWNEGYSAGWIAAMFGFTRSSIIGKVHRLGLKPRMTIKRTIDSVGSPRPRQPRRKPEPRVIDVVSVQPMPVLVQAEDAKPLHLDLLALSPNQCRWPYGDGPFTFCGCHKASGPYCLAHSAIAGGGYGGR